MSQWHAGGLPEDSACVDNAITVACSRQWSLLVDPHGLARAWLEHLHPQDLQVGQAAYDMTLHASCCGACSATYTDAMACLQPRALGMHCMAACAPGDRIFLPVYVSHHQQ